MNNLDIVRDVVTDIYNTHQKLTAEILLSEAIQENHVLHNFFEWNDTVAGEKYRIQQANQLIRSLKIAVIAPDNQYKSIRGFVNLASERPHTTFTPLSIVQTNENMHREMLQQYAKDAKTYLHRFANMVASEDFHNRLPDIEAEIDQNVEIALASYRSGTLALETV